MKPFSKRRSRKGDAVKLLTLITSVTILSGCAHFEDRGEIITSFISKRDCGGAENYVRQMAGDDSERLFGLGAVYSDCYRNREKAVEYLRSSAQRGNSLAVDALIQLGEKPPEAPKTIYRDRVVQQPPVIIQQQQQQQRTPPMGSNANSCIQDGGSLFCPNHPNTRPMGPVYR